MDIQEYQVGVIMFRHQKQLTQLQIQTSKGSEDSEDYLIIDWGDYQRHGWNQLIKDIKTINAKQFHIWNNKQPSILKEIVPISFPFLQTLNLRSNLIFSIEPLIYINFPALKQLDLANNYLTSTKILVKINARNLSVICLKQNPIVNFQHLFKTNFPKLKNIELSAETEYLGYYKTIPDYIIWKVKLPNCLTSDIQYRNYQYGYHRARRTQNVKLSYVKYKQQLHKKANTMVA